MQERIKERTLQPGREINEMNTTIDILGIRDRIVQGLIAFSPSFNRKIRDN